MNGRVVNLTVHGIGTPVRPLEPGEDRTWVSTAQFEQALDEVVAARADGVEVRITFDDGNSSDLEIGLPRLLERGLTAEFFLLAGHLDEPGRVDRVGVAQLLENGMTVGSHGWSHVDWRKLDDGGARQEMGDAARVLTGVVGAPVRTVAVPFGSYDRRVLNRLRRAGVKRVYTSDGGPARVDDWLQARTSLHRDLTPRWLHTVLRDEVPVTARARRAAAKVVKRVR